MFNFFKKKTIEVSKEEMAKLIDACQTASCCLLNHDVKLEQLDEIIEKLENKLVS